MTSRIQREMGRFTRFLMVGVLATFVDFGVLNLLEFTILVPEGDTARRNVLIASALAYVCGVTFSFFLNRYWIYPETQGYKRVQFMQFFGVYIVALVIRLIVISFVYPVWQSVVLTAAPTLRVNQIASNLAQATAIATTMLWNFGVNRLWTFGDVD